MATKILSRTLFSKPTATKALISSILSRHSSSSSLLRPLSAAAVISGCDIQFGSSARSFATRPTTSSLNDPNPNWSNRPPKETILLDGCDFEHWLVVMEKPEGDPTRDEIIDSYIKTLAKVIGSEEEARMKIYSVSTRCYYAFGALVSEELSYKLKELPGVRWVLPDSYLDVPNKSYGGEPFIDGKAVPYDPKYHEEWIRNNARAQERNRRNDRPRNNDRSRNFDRRRENMANREFQNRDGANQAMGGAGGPPPPPNYPGPPPPPPNYGSRPGGPPPPPPNYGGPGGSSPPPPNYGGPGGPPPLPPNFQGGGPGGPPPPPPPHYGGGPGGPPPPNYGGFQGGPPPPSSGPNYTGTPSGNMGGMPPNVGWGNNNPGMQHNYQNVPNNGGMAYQGPPGNYRND